MTASYVVSYQPPEGRTTTQRRGIMYARAIRGGSTSFHPPATIPETYIYFRARWRLMGWHGG